MKSLFAFLFLLPILTGTIMAQTVVNSRTSDLQPGGYEISGNAILEELSSGVLQLRLDNEFDTPAGPDVRIFLSDDPQSISNAIEIADIGSVGGGLNHFKGSITLDVPTGITIDQYDYIVFYCVDFAQHWAHGTFGVAQGDGGNPMSTFACKESLTATTNWVAEVNVCSNDGLADFIPLKNNINEPVGAHYAFIITDEMGAINQVIQADSFNFEGSGEGINRVYGVSYDGELIYHQGDLYTSITSDSCAIVSSSDVFLTIFKEHCKANISGKITHPDGNPRSDIEVFLNDDDSTKTNEEGIFEFKYVSTKTSYTITPKENSAVSQGVNTGDLVIIRKHILGIETMTSGIQIIAADVSNNGRVSTGDLLQLQRLILGIYEDFPNNQSWRFINALDLATGQLDLSNFTEAFTIDNLTTDTADVDFIGVKIGDVSNAVSSGLLEQEIKSQNTLQFEIKDVLLKAGERISIPVSAKNFRNIEAFQFTINLDGLVFENMASEVLQSNKLQFAQLDSETITTLWSNESPLDTDQSIFTLDLLSTKDVQLSEGISFNSSVTPAIAYTSSAESMDIVLSVQSTPELIQGNSNELFQNTPNPFINETSIPFYLNDGGQVTLNIYDTSGRVISTKISTYDKGDHLITLKNLDTLPEGMLYYQLASSGFTETKKMVRLLR